jgi:hypothetical protein
MQMIQVGENKIINLDAIIYAENLGGESLKIVFSGEAMLILSDEEIIKDLWTIIQSRALSFYEYADEFGVDLD